MSLTHLVVENELAFGGFSTKKEFSKIVDVWASICAKKSTDSLPELFDYVKSKQTVSTQPGRGIFPVFDASGCDLEDNAVACLVEALAMRPAVAKLDISSSDLTSQSVDVLLRLLRGQAKLVRSVDLDARLQLALLGEVVFDYTESLDHEVVQEIAMLSSALNLVNAQVYIRSAFLRKQLQEPLSAQELETVWIAVMGDALLHEMDAAFLAAGLQDHQTQHVDAPLSYAQLEAVLLCGLIDRGVVAVPNEWQMNAINFSPEWLQTYHDRAVTHTLSTASRDSPRSASSPKSPYSPGARGVPVVQLDIPETELSGEESESQDADGLAEDEEYGEEAHPYDEELDAAPAVPHLGYSRHDTPPGPMVTASLFASKYFRKAQRDEASPAQASSVLQSPSGSTKPAASRARAPASEVPPVMSPTKPASRAHTSRSPRGSTSGGPGELDIRVDKIRELQALTGGGSPAPVVTPRSAAPHTYFDPSLSSTLDTVSDAEYLSSRNSTGKDARTSLRGDGLSADSGIDDTTAAAQGGFALDINFNDSSPRKLNVLTVCNLSRGDYELGDQIGWPRDRPHPVSVLVLRDNGISFPERLSLHLRFECLTDLDLSFNSITGAVKGLPTTLLRLNLSHNRISNVSHLINCVNLVDLNLSHNNIKSFHVLPPRLEVVNLSHNVICAAITLRSLALSPKITHLDVTNNPILLEMKDWKVVLPSILEHLVELNGKPLIYSRKVTAFTLSKRRGSTQAPVELPPNPVQNRVSPQEQFVGDALRMRRDEAKFDVLEEARRSYADRFRNRSAILRPKQVQELTERLVAPTKAFQLRSSAMFSPPRLFSEQDLLHRKYPPRETAGKRTPAVHTPPRSDAVRQNSGRSEPVKFYAEESYSPKAETQHLETGYDIHPEDAGSEERKATEPPASSAAALSPQRNSHMQHDNAHDDEAAPQLSQHAAAKTGHMSPLIAARAAKFNKSPAPSREAAPQTTKSVHVAASAPSDTAKPSAQSVKQASDLPPVPMLQLSELDEDAQSSAFAIHLDLNDPPQAPPAPTVAQERLPAWTKSQGNSSSRAEVPQSAVGSPPRREEHTTQSSQGSMLGQYLDRMYVSEDSADGAQEGRGAAPQQAASPTASSNAPPGSMDRLEPEDRSFFSLSSANEAPHSALSSAPDRTSAFTPTVVSPLTVPPDSRAQSYRGTPVPDDASAQVSEASSGTKLSAKDRLLARMAKNKL